MNSSNPHPLQHSYTRLICIRRINEALTPKDRADTVERAKKILAYLIHRQTRKALKANGGFWGRQKIQDKNVR